MFRVLVTRRLAVCLVAAFAHLVASGSAHAEERRLDAWQFLTDPSAVLKVGTLPADGWRPAVANRSWNAQFEDLRDYFGVAWYKATVQVTKRSRGERVLVRFGAVDHFAEVFVNGVQVGTHEGAYTPFTVDLSDHVRPGANELVVRVIDPPPTPPGGTPRFPGIPYEELPRGKQNWYIQNGGLWQPVVVDIRPALYIERVHITPNTTGTLKVDVEIAGQPVRRSTTMVKCEVRGPDGRVVASLPVARVTGAGNVVATGTVDSPKLWSPASPTLYSADVSLQGGSTDRATARFGFREFTARDGQFFLNGQPFYMRGALDQDFYADSIYSTPDKAFVVDMMRKGRTLGLNLLRCHIKVCDPTYLEAADEVGMLVWYEVPSWDRWTPGSVARGRKTFDDMVSRDWNHPSIVIQSLINEAWGIDMTKADQRAGLRQMVRRCEGASGAARPSRCRQQRLLRELPSEIGYRRLPSGTTRFPTTPTDGTSGSPTSRRVRHGPTPLTAMAAAAARSRSWSRSSVIGDCPTCPKPCRGGSRATSTGGRSRGRPACSRGSRRWASSGCSRTMARSHETRSGASSRA